MTTSASQELITALGRDLYEAERRRTPRSPFSDEHPDLTVADAYRVQEAYASLRLADGVSLAGRKIGATSEAIQTLFSIDQPDFGHLFDDMIVDEGTPIRLDTLIQPMVEPEIAFVLDRELRGPGVTPEDVVKATRHVVACIEVIDSRFHDWRIRFVDTVADNGSSARCVLGADATPVRGLDLRSIEVELSRDGVPLETASGDAVLGHPANAVAWLANALAPFDRGLRVGEYVLSGSFTTAHKAQPGDTFRAVFSHLGAVSCSFI